MPESEQNQIIIETLFSHPKASEIRKTAHAITDIVFLIRKNNIFGGILKDNKEIGPQTVGELNRLIKKFKNQIALLLQIKLAGTDTDIYQGIIYPLVIKQLDQSA